MKNNNLKSIILCAAIINSIIFNSVEVEAKSVQASDKIENKSNALRVFNNYKFNLDADKFDDFWTPENEGYLDQSQKERINELKNKVNEGKILSGNEKNELKNMKTDVIRKKLGDEKYEELEKLIKKREGSVDLTLEERQRLYELEKEAK